MMKRPTHIKRGWLYCAATGLLLMGPSLVHAQTSGAEPAKPKTTKSSRTDKKPNPLVIAVKRELGRFKVTKKQKPAPTKSAKSTHGKTPVRPAYSEFAGNRRTTRTRQSIQQTAGRRNASSGAKKPGLLDRLLGLDKPQKASRPVTAKQNVPKKSNGIPGLIPSFLKPKPRRTAVRRPTLAPTTTPQQTASQPPMLVLKKRPLTKTNLDDLDNPFPEGDDTDFDEDLTQVDVAPKVADTPSVNADVEFEVATPEENPFSGLKLEEPQQFEKPIIKSASGTVEADPFAEPKETTAKSDSAPPLPLDDNELDVTDEEPVAASEPEEETPAEDSPEEKLKKLADRDSIGGLKGFCPVALRDQRDLVDADTNISSTYEEQTFHFSTDEAKAKFDAEPTKYAPIHSGHDVIVLTQGDVELEGTLEYAVWFKDRLYLFSSAATLETFVGNPAKYAALAAGETIDEDSEEAATDVDSDEKSDDE